MSIDGVEPQEDMVFDEPTEHRSNMLEDDRATSLDPSLHAPKDGPDSYHAILKDRILLRKRITSLESELRRKYEQRIAVLEAKQELIERAVRSELIEQVTERVLQASGRHEVEQELIASDSDSDS